jgi:lipopolysaccharide/colanic/teichoic acid biosynthesis glycosyltransferase
VGILRLNDVGRTTDRSFGECGSRHDASEVAVASFAKSVSDVVVAAVLLVILSPLMLALAVAIKLESAGPVLYRSRRVGLRGEEFEMLKFRKMHRDAAGPPLTSRHDERLTGVGSFLLRTKFDELPQLWNVVRGHMSLVGPRPEAPIFVGFYPGDYQMVLRVKPGITGLSQLAFAKENDILERPELIGSYTDRLLPAKIALDSLYIARRSLFYDARILIWTFGAIALRLDVAVDRDSGKLSVRRRPDASSTVFEEGT